MDTHYAFPNCGVLCSHCGYIMDGSQSDYAVQPFSYILICVNTTCPHYGIKYHWKRELGIELEKV